MVWPKVCSPWDVLKRECESRRPQVSLSRDSPLSLWSEEKYLCYQLQTRLGGDWLRPTCSSCWLFSYLGYNEMGLHYGPRQRECSLSLRERVTGDLMKALEMMKVVVGTDLEFLVQGRKKKPLVSPSPSHFFSIKSAAMLLWSAGMTHHC